MRRYGKAKATAQNTIAVIFDFDDTLTDDAVTGLLSKYGIDAVEFWKERSELVHRGWSPPLAYMKLMIDLAQRNGRLSLLTAENLREFGKGLKFYQGIPKIFDELRTLIKSEYKDARIDIEYYVISGGLQEIVAGSKIKPYLRDFWGSDFFFNPKTGRLAFPKSAITFTEKTRCLYQINKGLVGPRYKRGPHAVNEPLEERRRRIPFSNMIYVGDGLTDVACMAILDDFGGTTFGVFDPEKLEKEEYKAKAEPWHERIELLLKRGVPVYPARYDKSSRLRRDLENNVRLICHRIITKRKV